MGDVLTIVPVDAVPVASKPVVAVAILVTAPNARVDLGDCLTAGRGSTGCTCQPNGSKSEVDNDGFASLVGDGLSAVIAQEVQWFHDHPMAAWRRNELASLGGR